MTRKIFNEVNRSVIFQDRFDDIVFGNYVGGRSLTQLLYSTACASLRGLWLPTAPSHRQSVMLSYIKSLFP